MRDLISEIIIDKRNILIPREWGIEDYKAFTGKVDEYFEGSFGIENYWTWTKLSASSYGLMIEIELRLDNATVGEIYIYQNENNEDGKYYLFEGCDVFPAVPDENDMILDKLSDVADAFYDMFSQ